MNRVENNDSSHGTRMPKVVILAKRPEQSPLYSWLEQAPFSWQAIEPEVGWEPEADTDLIVTHRHYGPIEVSVLENIFRMGRTPILLLMDGILEYRNTWMNSELPPGTFLAPAFAHKIACVGASQARRLQFWSPWSGCEVIGLPRLDDWRTADFGSSRERSVKRVLVATARRAGFSPSQRLLTAELLIALHERFEKHRTSGGDSLEVQWRISQEMRDFLKTDVASERACAIAESEPSSTSLREQLEECDAVFCTPSTLMIEAMLLDKPVVSLEPHGVPAYLPTAWTISRADDFDTIVNQLSPVDPLRLQFQRETLFDAYAMEGSATDRLLRLIERMIDRGRAVRESHAEAGSLVSEHWTLDNPASLHSPVVNRQLSALRAWWQTLDEAFPAVAPSATSSEALALAQYQALHQESNELLQRIRSLEARQRQLEHAETRALGLEERCTQLASRLEEQMVRNRDLQARLKASNERAEMFQERLQKLRDSRGSSGS